MKVKDQIQTAMQGQPLATQLAFAEALRDTVNVSIAEGKVATPIQMAKLNQEINRTRKILGLRT